MRDAINAIPPQVTDGLSKRELGVLELMLRKERKTAVYARAYGIEHLPVVEQRREIKRVKDRLQKRLNRAREGNANES